MWCFYEKMICITIQDLSTLINSILPGVLTFKCCFIKYSGIFALICSMEYYMEKTYRKTASLISNSCKAIAILAGQTAKVATLASEYGKNLVCWQWTHVILCIFLLFLFFLFSFFFCPDEYKRALLWVYWTFYSKLYIICTYDWYW